ncbi:Mandelate racemase/muconate lactonizing protein [Methylobacterium sp. 4-46]|uniref:enolase C-terminal domain-like protein n=2 Tax=Methylobacterium TaxID=407 RepID=UPI000152D406|nr:MULTISPECIES: enolase C-terminal domain-like protein [Methylobacterium]ACA18016.1 Mandelate racemase/muconate lactonizing protein [Methylobacterium sp. 4-46]WFT77317.1 enolase C-terminal domain-like protein [Methylobacterium nodulans]
MSAPVIDRMRLFPIESPIRMARLQGVGTVEGAVTRVLLDLTASDGVVGWGEAAPWAVFTGTPEAAFAALDRYLRPLVLGAPVRRIRALGAAMDRALVGHAEAKLAVETALFDILGRQSGLSVADLLGGRVRDTIPLSFSIADPDFAADLDRMRAMVPAGARIVKVKTGMREHRREMARLEAIRAEFGAALDLRVDDNQALAPFGAIRLLRDVETLAPTFIEQPVARGHLAAMTSLAAALDTPILADESCFDASDLAQIVRLGAADAISVKLMKTGGLLKAQGLMALADAAGLPGYGGTLWEGGVALAAGTQFIAATPGVSLGCEFYMPHHVLIEDVLETRVENRGGEVVVPDGPGLGITVSEHAVRANARVRAQA